MPFADAKQDKVITEPVNQDVNKEDLGKTPDDVKVEDVTDSKAGSVPTLAVGEGAGTVTNPNPYQSHLVEIEDHTKLPHHFYDYKIVCKTCGWTSRTNIGTTTLQGAEDIALQHIEARKQLVTGRYFNADKH